MIIQKMNPNFFHDLIKINMIIGGRQLLPPPPSKLQVIPEAKLDRASPLNLGRLVGQFWGQTARHWLETFRDGRPVKVHC